MQGDVPAWATAVIGLVTPAVVLALWLAGRIMRPHDCDQRVRAVVDQRNAEREAWDKGMALLEDRLQAVVADRDAWRAAQKEESEARAAAERAASQLLDSTQLSVQLLDALREALGGKGDR